MSSVSSVNLTDSTNIIPTLPNLKYTPTLPNTLPNINMGTTTDELNAFYDQIFGTNGVQLEAIANINQNTEWAIAKVDTFSDAKGKDPVEWLKIFNRVAITNKWIIKVRKKAVARAFTLGIYLV